MKLALFDLDNTLYPEAEFVRGGFSAVARFLEQKHGLNREDMTRRMVEILMRQGRGGILDQLLNEIHLSQTILSPLLTWIYRSHEPEIRLFRDVPQATNRLHEKGWKVGIITDGMASVQRRKVASLGLEEIVDFVLCTEELGKGFAKPSPVPFAVCLEMLGVRPENCFYAGDDPGKDFHGPRSLGIPTIHVRRPIEPGFEILTPGERLEADYMTEDLASLPIAV